MSATKWNDFERGALAGTEYAASRLTQMAAEADQRVSGILLDLAKNVRESGEYLAHTSWLKRYKAPEVSPPASAR